MQTELLKLVERTTKSLIPSESATPLADLLILLTEQFRAITDAHKVVIDQFQRAASNHRVQLTTYDLPEVWARIQAVVSLITFITFIK